MEEKKQRTLINMKKAAIRGSLRFWLSSFMVLLSLSLILSSCQLQRSILENDITETGTSEEEKSTSITAFTTTDQLFTTASESTAESTTIESLIETTTSTTDSVDQSTNPSGTKTPVSTTTRTNPTTTRTNPTTTRTNPTTTRAAPPTTVATKATTAASSGGAFVYKNYGAFFRDQYGSNAKLVNGAVDGVIKATLDIGSVANGVVLVKVDTLPANVHCVVQIHKDGGMDQFDVQSRGSWIGMPLARGNGSYRILVAFDIGNNVHQVALEHTFSVSLASSLKPFTASSIIANFSRGSASVALAGRLCSPQSSLDGKIDAVYNWIVNNISYNRSLAAQITNKQVVSYLPDPDKTLNSRSGICYDYASLMCAMLRSQGIATRMIMGSTPQGYHAWNEVYIDGTGWVVVAGFSWRNLSGASWTRFDTTFAAGGMTSEQISKNNYSKIKTY